MKWRRQSRANTSMPTLIYKAELPHALMSLERAITLDRKSSIVYCEETASNLSTFDRPISWNHHVTFGPPFLEADVTTFDMPGRTAAERERNFVVIFAAMVGAVSVARIFTESADRHKVLADMRDHLLRSF